MKRPRQHLIIIHATAKIQDGRMCQIISLFTPIGVILFCVQHFQRKHPGNIYSQLYVCTKLFHKNKVLLSIFSDVHLSNRDRQTRRRIILFEFQVMSTINFLLTLLKVRVLILAKAKSQQSKLRRLSI